MPTDFVDVVDFTPNIHAPISVDTGMKSRLCKRNILFRQPGFGGLIAQDQLLMPRIQVQERLAKQHYEEQILLWRDWIRDNPLFETNRQPKYSIDDWLDHSNYSGARKKQLLSRLDRPKDYYPVKTFIKKEAYPELKPPRTINSRDDAFKVLVGPFTHAIEKDVFGSKYSLKGKTLKEQNQIFFNRLRDKKVFISTDYSRWESSISPEIIRYIEMDFFRRYPSPYPWDFHSWLQSHILDNRLVSQGANKLTMNGVRMSGDMHTSLMNTYINLYLTAFICHNLNLTWDGFFEGDDGFIGLDQDVQDLEVLKNQFSLFSSELGFDLKIEVSRDISELPYLSRHCVSEGVAIREPFKAICHAQWSFSLHNHNPVEIQRSRGYGLALENEGSPILQSLGNMLLRRSGAGKLWYSDPWFKTYYNLPDFVSDVQFNTQISSSTRVKFQQLFGISVALQLEIEESLDQDDLEAVKENLNALFLRHKPEWRRNYYLCRDTPTWFIHVDVSDN